MPDHGYVLAAVLVSAAVTWALRAVPFALLAPLRRSPLVPYLGATMPVGVMVVLVVHTLRDTPVLDPVAAAPTAMALVATVGLHLWRHNVVLSIAGGTLVHVVLASVVLA